MALTFNMNNIKDTVLYPFVNMGFIYFAFNQTSL